MTPTTKASDAVADGWIEHDGNKDFIGDGLRFDVKLRDGTEIKGLLDSHLPPGAWHHIYGSGDIVSYRVVEA